jgi:hypothetical protein
MYNVYQQLLPENRPIMKDYLDSWSFEAVHKIIIAIDSPHNINGSLNWLVDNHMALTEEKLNRILSATKYQIDNTDSIQMFFNNTSLEKVCDRAFVCSKMLTFYDSISFRFSILFSSTIWILCVMERRRFSMSER